MKNNVKWVLIAKGHGVIRSHYTRGPLQRWLAQKVPPPRVWKRIMPGWYELLDELGEPYWAMKVEVAIREGLL
jgi:hypothetical protein